MKIKNITNIAQFFKVIDSCEGKVELVGEDIRLNLKSKLSQMLSLANIFVGENGEIPELEILVYNQNDVDRLLQYMINAEM